MKDPAAWRELGATEREMRTARYVQNVDVSSSESLQSAEEFLTARGETAAIESIAKRAVARDPSDAWGRRALGQSEIGKEADVALRQSENAEEAGEENYVALKDERAKHTGAWWLGGDELKRVRGLIAGVKEADERFRSPYWQGVEKWARLQRATHIMQDHPALHVASGPYVIFVQLNTEKGAQMKDVAPEELERGKRILERNRKLMAAYYDGWMETMGPIFGFTRYGPENADVDTLMKMNVFTTRDDYRTFNADVDSKAAGFARAYYSPEDPRFITTYDSADESTDYVDQVQCHEATHQLVHFYSWDLTRKDLGHAPDYLKCSWRPLWSGEGFAEFFSAHRVVDGRYVWMQPLDERMRQIWIFEEIMKEKGWTPWRPKEFFYTLQNGRQLEDLALGRSRTRADDGAATVIMANLFYAKAWSFVYFLWYAEEGGRPKYRDRFVQFKQYEFHIRYKFDKSKGAEVAQPVGINDFRRIMGLEKDDALAAFGREWEAYEEKLVESHRLPKWTDERAKARKALELDK